MAKLKDNISVISLKDRLNRLNKKEIDEISYLNAEVGIAIVEKLDEINGTVAKHCQEIENLKIESRINTEVTERLEEIKKSELNMDYSKSFKGIVKIITIASIAGSLVGGIIVGVVIAIQTFA